MKLKCLCILLSGFLFLPAFQLYSQSNEVIDALLEQKEASIGSAAYIVLSAAGLLSDDTGIEDAFLALKEQKWIKIKEEKTPNSPVKLGEFSFILMKAFDIKGGILYSIFPGTRYAAKELACLGFIDGDKSPYRYVSGEEVLQMLGSILDLKEEEL